MRSSAERRDATPASAIALFNRIASSTCGLVTFDVFDDGAGFDRFRESALLERVEDEGRD